MTKNTYGDGQKAAAASYGLTPDDVPEFDAKKKSRSWLPALAAGGLGAFGAYKFLRAPRFSANPALAAIQQEASTKGFHRAVDVTRMAPAVEPSILKRIWRSTLPQVNAQGELDALNRAKLWFHEGSEAIPIATHPVTGKSYIPGHPKGVDVQGYTFDRTTGPMAGVKKNPIRGGVDIEGPLSTQKALDQMSARGKGFEAELLQTHAPTAIPHSISSVSKFAPTGKPSVEGAAQLQKALREHLQQQGITDFALKPTHGVASGGAFPRADADWAAAYQKFQQHLARPSNARAYRKVLRGGSLNDISDYLRHHNIMEGATIHQALKNPKSVMAQEWRPGALGEYRVHAMQGTAPRELIMARYPESAAKTTTSGVDVNALQRFVEQDVLDKLPAKYRRGSYGMDVMPFRRPDGSVEFKVLELNPHQRGSAETAGGGSGLLMPEIRPGAGWRHYKAITGRHAEPVAAGGALAAGLGSGALARALTPGDDDETPHPAG